MGAQNDKIKTTILLNKTIKKLAQLYAIENNTSLGKVIEKALKELILKED